MNGSAPSIQVIYSDDVRLSDEARNLVDFDVDSVSQVIRADRGPAPDIWLARPDGYQSGDHVLRDSDSIRLIAYSHNTSLLYGTDGCNTCRHNLPQPLGGMSETDLCAFASDTQIPFLLLGKLIDHL